MLYLHIFFSLCLNIGEKVIKLGKPKKSSSLNGRAIKRGGGKGPAIKEKNLFLELS